MTTVRDIGSYLEEFAPTRLAEEWDNVGHLVGDQDRPATRVMTCLSVTPDSVEEAISEQADLIVTHHPFPFRPLRRITAATVTGRLLLELIAGGVGVLSPHTALDSAVLGINQKLAEGLELVQIEPLRPIPDDPERLGAGRWGRLPRDLQLSELAERLKAFLSIEGLHQVGLPTQRASKVAVACGSGGQLLAAARDCGCEVMVTGETNFHTCLEAEATGVGLLLPGHFASERFAVEQLAEVLAERFPQVAVWPSGRERDPLSWV